MGFWSEVKDFGKEVSRWHEDALTLGQGWEAPADLVTGGAISQKEAAKEARRKQLESLSAAERLQQEGIDQARTDINRLFPQAMEAQRGGYQGALDVFGQALPAQANVFQQGNVGAQQAILAGLPMAQAAILGGQIDYSGLQPFQAQTPDLSFFQQTLPAIQAQRDEEARLAQHRAQAQAGAQLAREQAPANHQQMVNNWVDFARGALGGQAQPQQPQLGDISGGFMSKLLAGAR
ncbi:MAG: hypothetical protein GY954_03860 [Alteromonas sp.]|nr:hypothetical protein [Alteromonas sp.]